jgi:hypothetical protein
MDRYDSREALEEQKLSSEELIRKESNPTLPKNTIIVGNKYTLSSPSPPAQKKNTRGEEADGSGGRSRDRLSRPFATVLEERDSSGNRLRAVHSLAWSGTPDIPSMSKYKPDNNLRAV